MASRQTSHVLLKAVLLLLLLGSSALILSAYVPNPANAPLIVAHRGASGYAPENTMASFELAELMAADYIELDVRLSKDGELAVIHDVKVDRTTNGSGFVHDYAMNELRRMDAGSFYDPGYSGETISTLGEVLDRFGGRIGLLIETKDPHLYPGLEQKLAEELKRHGRLDKVVLQSFDFDSTKRMHELMPDVPVAVLIHKDKHPLSDEALDELASYASYINYNFEQLDRKLVAEIHERGRKVMAWTIRREKDMKWMKKLGVDGIITDFPA
ncbi:glycerophosphodiester phosphodiesterase [Paenibacillus arenilitoris]|uniref:Glycerophosphodiester phosphodiesterase n=1 Tax=Paenibacillus arenilitoris TaxID=2772299 RepID=A0A927CMM9_9BACL|nr:glycerophosphodiester phosphodiesterase family protein [Paenibacillus arenilitoris]MBD2869378.1 glycerophosphodiester phosphodiesterase [Paenibacillus arenilitoris]